jgi:hypothetical protein
MSHIIAWMDAHDWSWIVATVLLVGASDWLVESAVRWLA